MRKYIFGGDWNNPPWDDAGLLKLRMSDDYGRKLPNILNHYGLYDYSSLKYDGSFGPQKEYEQKLLDIHEFVEKEWIIWRMMQDRIFYSKKKEISMEDYICLFRMKKTKCKNQKEIDDLYEKELDTMYKFLLVNGRS